MKKWILSVCASVFFLLTSFFGLVNFVDNDLALIKCIIFNVLALISFLLLLKGRTKFYKAVIIFLIIITLLNGAQAVKRLSFAMSRSAAEQNSY